MASKRVMKSAVDWAKFGQFTPPNQAECYKAFKAKSDMFLSRVHKYPAELPKIDFAAYRSRVTNPALIDAMEKGYGSVSIPYPKDAKNMKAKIEAQEKEAKVRTDAFVAEATEQLKLYKRMLQTIEELPHLDEMTMEMYRVYFPQAPLTVDKPSIYPFTKNTQPGCVEGEVKSNFLLPRKWWDRNLNHTVEDKKYLW